MGAADFALVTQWHPGGLPHTRDNCPRSGDQTAHGQHVSQAPVPKSLPEEEHPQGYSNTRLMGLIGSSALTLSLMVSRLPLLSLTSSRV